jgi:hypothetical protein
MSGDLQNLSLDSAGTINPAAGEMLRQAIPANIIDAAHSAQSAWLLVLALGLERGGGTADERRLLETQLGGDRAARCLALRAELDGMEQGLMLPLFELAVPARKARPAEQLDYLFELLARLAAADGEVTLFEYLLQRSLRAHLIPAEERHAPQARRDEARLTVLAFIAARSRSGKAAIAAAFDAGLASLGARDADAAAAILRQGVEAADFDDLDRALDLLAAAPAAERRALLKALAVTMRHDRKIEIAEAESFRAIAAVLGCPVPPLHVIG